jgi:hypothetical protein
MYVSIAVVVTKFGGCIFSEGTAIPIDNWRSTAGLCTLQLFEDVHVTLP